MIDVEALAEARYSAESIQEMYCAPRWGRTATFAEEKQRIEKFDRLYRAEGTVPLPNRIDAIRTEPYNTQNAIHDSTKSAARAISQSQPFIRCRAIGGDEESKDAALLRQAVAMGYRLADRLATLAEEMVMHLIGGAAVYLLCDTRPHIDGDPAKGGCGEPPYGDCEDESHSDYPVHELWHPRGVYPTWQGTRLVDIMYCQRMRLRDAAWAWPHLGIRFDPNKDEWGELLTYLTKDEKYRCIWPESGGRGPSNRGPAQIIEYNRHRVQRVPVAWVKEPSFHGNFEGMFDQAEGMQNFKNHAATLAMIATKMNVFQESWGKGVLSHKKGPLGHVELDPNPAVDAGYGLIGNKELPRSLLAMLGIADADLRGALDYPAQPGGQNLPSIISGAGVEAVSGRENRLNAHIQFLVAQVWEQQSDIDRRIDVAYLDYNKPLMTGSGNRATYTPSQVWRKGSRYLIEAMYPGIGESPFNRGVFNLQKFGAGLMSDEEFLEQDPNTVDPQETIRRTVDFNNRKLVYQMAMSQATLESAVAFAAAVQNGDTVFEAAKLLVQREQEAAAAQAQPTPEAGGNVIPFPGGQTPAEQQELALAKGGQPGGTSPSLQPEFAPQPLPMVQIRGPQG
jgi:hypothetical protein